MAEPVRIFVGEYWLAYGEATAIVAARSEEDAIETLAKGIDYDTYRDYYCDEGEWHDTGIVTTLEESKFIRETHYME